MIYTKQMYYNKYLHQLLLLLSPCFYGASSVENTSRACDYDICAFNLFLNQLRSYIHGEKTPRSVFDIIQG